MLVRVYQSPRLSTTGHDTLVRGNENKMSKSRTSLVNREVHVRTLTRETVDHVSGEGIFRGPISSLHFLDPYRLGLFL